jgi:hypothetical protein
MEDETMTKIVIGSEVPEKLITSKEKKVHQPRKMKRR